MLNSNFHQICGIRVHRIGIGTGRLASLGSGYSQRDARALLHAAVDAGINLIDTADSYGSTDCESLLGRLLVDFPGHFKVSTKAGYPYCELPKPFGMFNQFGKKLLAKLGARPDFSAKRITSCIEGSLRRLKRERLDFFLLHDPPSDVWTQDELRQALEYSRAAGKILHFGISTSNPQVIASYARDPLVELLQTPVNPFRVVPPIGDLPVIANHVFGAGALLQRKSTLYPVVKSLAEKYGLPVRSILIAYASSQPSVRCVLSGTGSAAHLIENSDALKITLDPEDLNLLDSHSPTA